MKLELSTLRTWIARLLAFAVGFHGLALLAITLGEQLRVRGMRSGIASLHFTSLIFELPILLGLGLLYLSVLLRRSKQTAWLTALVLYGFLLTANVFKWATLHGLRPLNASVIVRDFLLPLLLVSMLVYERNSFKVKSDVRSFAVSLRISVLVLAVAFVYGVVGFMLFDVRDFHQEITPAEAVHRTLDQFDLTTNGAIMPHTRRARLFLDSLSIVSVGAVSYAALSLFQPLRARLTDQSRAREQAKKLLDEYHGDSEDFFKVWPEDKSYFFDTSNKAGLAYQVRRGIALVAGDPFGNEKHFSQLLSEFADFCYVNDWRPAFVHTHPRFSKLYKKHGYNLQKIGEEAVVDITNFNTNVRRNKYFRNVYNRFTKNGYTVERLQPPHTQAVILRLKEVTEDWLTQPGRSERGFMMGYFSEAYLQQCDLFVVKDEAGTIRGFINQIPSYKPKEANYDLLRSTSNSQSNTNDFLLIEFLQHLGEQGYERLNIGLCPLAGMDEVPAGTTVVDRALRFVYANGDRFYSFSGLHRFKVKYEPEWSDRYIAYRGGLPGFTRVVAALNTAMKVRTHKS